VPDCSHAYRVKSGILWYCLKCKEFFKDSDEQQEYSPVQMPPKIYLITERLWRIVSPWPNIQFSVPKKYGWYISIIGIDEYLIMPVFKEGKPVFFSARKLTKYNGMKYKYPTGGKKELWTSGELKSPVIFCEGIADAAYVSVCNYSSVALLGSWYNSSLDTKLSGLDIILLFDGDVAGVVAAANVRKSLSGVNSVKTVCLPEGLDPTDLPIEELKELIRGES